MTKITTNEAAIPNPKLEPLTVLIGEWTTVGSHRLIEGALHGHTAFEWIEGGAFLKMSSEITEPKVPSGIIIIGSDDGTDMYYMLYFDERGVSRKYEMTLGDGVWKYWRNAPKFSQRFTGTFSEDGNTIVGVSELSEDDSTWKDDLKLTYTRVK